MTPLDKQVGGNHYQKFTPQPVEHIVEVRLPYCLANVFKYLSRYPNKGGTDDLKKAVHYVELAERLGETLWLDHEAMQKNFSWIRDNQKSMSAEQVQLMLAFNAVLEAYDTGEYDRAERNFTERITEAINGKN